MKEAIAAGIFNDLGSGSNVDLCVIKKDSVEYCKPYQRMVERGQRLVLYLACSRSKYSRWVPPEQTIPVQYMFYREKLDKLIEI